MVGALVLSRYGSGGNETRNRQYQSYYGKDTHPSKDLVLLRFFYGSLIQLPYCKTYNAGNEDDCRVDEK